MKVTLLLISFESYHQNEIGLNTSVSYNKHFELVGSMLKTGN